jgi:hypothetical protein
MQWHPYASDGRRPQPRSSACPLEADASPRVVASRRGSRRCVAHESRSLIESFTILKVSRLILGVVGTAYAAGWSEL